MTKNSKQAGNVTGIVMVIVVLVVVGAIGFLVVNKKDKKDTDGSMSSMSSSTAPAGSVTSKASDLRATLVSLGLEHMALTDSAVDAALNGTKDATAKATALYSNGTDIGAAVGSVYGKDAETTFNTVWKLHLDQFVAYAVASSKGDTTAKNTALSTIDAQYTKPLAQYLAKANPNLPEATLESALREHVAMTAKMIDDHTAGNFDQEQKDLTAANTHITGLFSTLAGAIAKQYPDKF